MNTQLKGFIDVLFGDLNNEYIEVRQLSETKHPKVTFYENIDALTKESESFLKEEGYKYKINDIINGE